MSPHPHNYTDEMLERLRQLNDDIANDLIPAMVYLAILMLIGVVGNLIVCFIFSFRLRMSTQHFLIIALAVFDLLSCFIAMPTEIVDMRYFLMFENEFACRLLRFVNSYCAFASILTLIVIATDRYLKVCRPLKTQMSLRHVKVALVVVLLGALFFAIPAPILYGIRTTDTEDPAVHGHDCSTNDKVKDTVFPLAYNSVLFLAFVVILVALTVIYVRIWREMKRHNRYMARNSVAEGSRFYKASQSEPSSACDHPAERNNSLVQDPALDEVFAKTENEQITLTNRERHVEEGSEVRSDPGKKSGVKSVVGSWKLSAEVCECGAVECLGCSLHKCPSVQSDTTYCDSVKDLSDMISTDLNTARQIQELETEVPHNAFESENKDLSVSQTSDEPKTGCSNNSSGSEETPAFSGTNSNVCDQADGNVDQQQVSMNVEASAPTESGIDFQIPNCLSSEESEKQEQVTGDVTTRDVSGGGERGDGSKGDYCPRSVDAPLDYVKTDMLGDSSHTDVSGDRWEGRGCPVSVDSGSVTEQPSSSVTSATPTTLTPIIGTSTVDDSSTDDTNASPTTTTTPESPSTIADASITTTANTNNSSDGIIITTANTFDNSEDKVDDSIRTKIPTNDNNTENTHNINTKSITTNGTNNVTTTTATTAPTNNNTSTPTTDKNSSDGATTTTSGSSSDFKPSRPTNVTISANANGKATTTTTAVMAKRPTRASKSVSEVKSHKATSIAMSVTVVFFLSFVPHLSLITARIVHVDFDRGLRGAALVFYNIFLRSYFINSVANPFIYGVLNARFRAECLRLAREIVGCERRPSLPVSTTS